VGAWAVRREEADPVGSGRGGSDNRLLALRCDRGRGQRLSAECQSALDAGRGDAWCGGACACGADERRGQASSGGARGGGTAGQNAGGVTAGAATAKRAQLGSIWASRAGISVRRCCSGWRAVLQARRRAR
jgi:hypothetical protein